MSANEQQLDLAREIHELRAMVAGLRSDVVSLLEKIELNQRRAARDHTRSQKRGGVIAGRANKPIGQS